MLSPGNPVGGAVTLTSNTSDTGGSGIAAVSYELAPNGGSFNSQAASWDTTLVADGLYDLHVTATDVAGNSTTSALVTTRVDNTPPALNFTTPAGGAVVSGTVNLVANASDASPASPPVCFEYKLHSDPASSYTATGAAWNTSSLPAGDGLYDLRATATDDAGNDTQVENTNVRVDNTAPIVSITAPAAAINGSLPSPTPFSANATTEAEAASPRSSSSSARTRAPIARRASGARSAQSRHPARTASPGRSPARTATTPSPRSRPTTPAIRPARFATSTSTGRPRTPRS